MSTRRRWERANVRFAPVAFALLIAAGLPPASRSASAADVVKANTTASLATGTSWVGGVAPADGDVAVWNATVTSSNATTYGGNLSWQGVRVVNPGGLVTLGNTSDTTTLTLGAAGVNLSSATQNLLLNGNLSVSGSQAWTVAAGRTLQVQTINTTRTLVGSGTMFLSNATGSGTATFDFRPGSNGSVLFTPQAGFSGYGGDWYIGPNTVVKTLRNGVNAWGSGTLYFAGGVVGQQQNFNGAWTNTISLVDQTTSTIDDFNTSGTRFLQLNGVIDGPGNLTFRETNAGVTTTKDSTYVLAAANTMSGTVSVSAGAFLRVGGVGGSTNTSASSVPAAGPAGTLGTAVVVATGGLAFTRTDALTVPNRIVGSGTVFVGSDNANLAATAAQDLTLTGSNSYAGGTEVARSTLRVASLDAIGTGYLGVRTSGTFVYGGTGAVTTSRSLALDSGPATIVIADPTASLTFDESRSKSGSLTKAGDGRLSVGGALSGTASLTLGAGTLALTSVASTNTGVVTVGSGMLEVSRLAPGGSASSLGASSNAASNLVLTGGTIAYVGSGDTTDREFTVAAAPTFLANGSGAVTWAGATPTYTTLGTSATFTLGGTSTVDNVWGTPLADNGAGVVSLTKVGGGTWVLDGAHTYTGPTTVSAGALLLGAGGSITSSTVSVAAGATFGGAGAAGATSVANGGVLAPGRNQLGSVTGTLAVSSLTFGAAAGDLAQVAIAVTGAGTPTTSSAVQVNGGLTTNGGIGSVTFTLGSALATLGTGTYQLLGYTGQQLASVDAFTWSGTTGARQGVALENAPQAIALVISNAYPIWSGSNGPGWATANNWTLDTTSAPTSFLAGDTVVFNDTAVSGTVTIAASDVSPASTTFANQTLDYTLGSGGGFGIAAGSLTKSGAAALTITNANTYAGLTTIAGGRLRLGDDGALGSGTVTLAGGSLSSVGAAPRSLANAIAIGADTTIGTVADAGAFSLTGPVDLGGAVRQLTLATDVSLAGNVGNGGLTKAGPGTLRLAGANGSLGAVAVASGTILVANGQSLGAGGDVTLNTAATGTEATSLLIDASGTTVNTSKAIVVSNLGGGATTIGSGSLAADHRAVFSGPVTLQRDVTLVAASGGDRTEFSGGISGFGGVTVATSGSGRMVVSGAASTFVGGLTLTAGSRLQLGDGVATSASLVPDATTVTMGGGAVLALAKSGTSESIDALVGSGTVESVVGTNTLVVGAADGSGTFAGALRNNGGTLAFTKAGLGVQTLTGTSTYTGNTTVASGSLVYAGNNSLGANLVNASGQTTAVVAFAGYTLAIGNSGSNSGGQYFGTLEGTGLIRLSGGTTTIMDPATGLAGASGNFQILNGSGLAGPVSATAFALDTGTSATDRKDFGYGHDGGVPLVLSSLSGYGAIRGDVNGAAGSTITRLITVDQATDTVFNGAVLSHRSTTTATRALTLTKTGSGSLTLAGFVGKQTVASQAGPAAVNLTVNGGVLNVTNPANTASTNIDAVNIGTVTISSGTLGFAALALLDTSGTLGATSIQMNGGVLRWNAANAQDISAGGRLTLVSTKVATFDTNGNDVTLATPFAGGIVDAGVAKIGTGRLTISSTTEYTGATAVAAGGLFVNGRLTGTAAVSVASGATLGGGGTIDGAVEVASGATFAPGASPGTLTLTGSLAWNPGSNYNWQMLSATGTAGAADAWDLMSVGGGLAIAATSADPFRINLETLSGAAPDVTGTAANFDAAQNYSWTIATAAGGISGFAADKFLITTSATNGTTGFANAFGGGTFAVAQSGNNLNLVFTAGTPTVVTITVATGTQTQTQAGYPTLSGSIPVVKTGGGTLVLDQANTLSGSTTVQGGVLQLANASALSASRLVVVAGGTGQVAPVTATSVASLDLAGGNGLLDLTSGALTISGGMTATALVAEILEGRGDGSWTGTSGITSSTAAAESAASTPRAVGWLDNGDGSLTAAYAAPGDTNLDWSIDILDASNFLAFGKFDTGSPATWIEGDFSYDGIVDILDAADFFSTALYDAGNYNTGDSAAGVAAVPEPAVLAPVAMPILAWLLARSRRRS